MSTPPIAIGVFYSLRYFQTFPVVCVFSENPAEDERHLREVGGSRLSRRSVPEAEEGRSHPGGERRQRGRNGLQRVSIKTSTVRPLLPVMCLFTALLFSFQRQGTDPIGRRHPQTAGGQDRLDGLA